MKIFKIQKYKKKMSNQLSVTIKPEVQAINPTQSIKEDTQIQQLVNMLPYLKKHLLEKDGGYNLSIVLMSKLCGRQSLQLKQQYGTSS